MRLLLATNNPGKVKEIKPIFTKAPARELISLADLGLFFEPAETGDTFEANAIQKATETLAFLRENGYDDITVLADDSGLCIDAMDGEPGVDSANFMGRETPYEVRNAYIISQLENKTRDAKFMCVIACAYPNGEIATVTGAVHGEITHEPAGEGGFGYDPIFYVPDYGKTMAELTPEEKNAISHRGQALTRMIELLDKSSLVRQYGGKYEEPLGNT